MSFPCSVTSPHCLKVDRKRLQTGLKKSWKPSKPVNRFSEIAFCCCEAIYLFDSLLPWTQFDIFTKRKLLESTVHALSCSEPRYFEI